MSMALLVEMDMLRSVVSTIDACPRIVLVIINQKIDKMLEETKCLEDSNDLVVELKEMKGLIESYIWE